ncbi:MAG: PL29 family lyase N-terminal domain-containing protein, partial [Alistipes sp.]
MKKYLMMLFVALAVGFQSCDNNDDLWNAIDDLKSRVQALETQVTALNGNVEALKTLYGGATISKVDNKAGVYTITLSNGETIVLTQGSDAKAVIPVMGINADGFWQVSYDSGKTFTSLGVKATATDGVTPKFRIEEKSGFWQVSYDNGTKYDYVLDAAGQKVSAIGDATVTDKFFQAVAVKDGKFEVTMLDGSKLSIPILSDFYCRFASIPTDVQTFAAGATKRFAVEIKGVDNTIVTAPDGWTAMLTDIVADKAELVITAPAAGTRATADNSKDVSILATAGSYACIAKLQVASSGVAPVPPTVAVANSTTTLPTALALTFDVTLSANAESWHYICQKSSVAAPEVAAVLAGTLGTGTSATVTGLEASTAYTIYVVATAGELNSTLASAENTTIAAPVTVGDYYTKYQAGENIVIGDLTISLATYGAAKSVKPSALTKEVLSAGGVIFVDNSDPTDLAVTLDGTSINLGEKFVLIGQYATSDQPQITTPELRCKYDAAFKNVHLIAAAATNLLTTGNATL